MSRLNVKNLKRGMSVSDVFLVDTANFKQARNGSHFVQLVLRDATGSVKALRWESNPEEFRLLESNPFLLTNGRVEEYQGNLQIIVDEMTPLSAKDANVDPAEFLPRTAHDIDAMENELRQIVAGIERTPIRELVEAILDRPGARDGLRGAPAGKTMHHAYVGGLLEHVLSLSKLALNVCNHYPWLDRSVLIAGVVLHDLGKIEELDYLSGFSYTAEGQLIGHIAMATQWIDEAARSIEGLDEETVLHLKHIVLSHHGRLEFGSPKVPATAEAMVLHFLDNLDAKLAGYLDAFRNVTLAPAGPDQSCDQRFGDYNTMFGTRLFFPGQLDQSVNAPVGPTPGPASGAASAPTPPAEPKRKSADDTGDLFGS